MASNDIQDVEEVVLALNEFRLIGEPRLKKEQWAFYIAIY